MPDEHEPEIVYIPSTQKYVDDLNLLHQIIHGADHDPEDTFVMAMTRRDYCALLTGLDLLINFFPCLTEEIEEFTDRIQEVRGHQRPEWEGGGDGS